MRNYIASNTEYNKGSKVKSISDHNDRSHSPDYLLSEEHRIYKNESYLFGGDSLENYYQQLRDKRIEMSSKHSNIRKNENEIIESVIIFSEEQARYYLDNNISLMNGLKVIANDFKAKYGFEPMQIDLHLDEGHIDKDNIVKYNIHAHITSYNFDFEKNRSVLRTMRKNDFELMQDIAAEAMQKSGFDFQRGVSKKESGLENQKRNDFVISKQNETIKDNEILIRESHNIKSELENIIDNLRSEKDEIDLDLKNSKVYRTEVKNDLTLSMEQKKSLYSEISEVQKSLRTKRKELVNVEKEIKSIKDLDTSLKKDTLEILKNSKTLLGFDENKLKKSIYQKIKQYSKIDIKSKEIDDLRQDKETLIEHVKKLIEDIEVKEARLESKDEIITDKAHEIKRLMQRDKNNANFTKSEIVEATLNYENEIQSLKTELIEVKQDKEVFKEKSEELKKFKEFVDENHKDIIEDFKDKRKNNYMRHR